MEHFQLRNETKLPVVKHHISVCIQLLQLPLCVCVCVCVRACVRACVVACPFHRRRKQCIITTYGHINTKLKHTPYCTIGCTQWRACGGTLSNKKPHSNSVAPVTSVGGRHRTVSTYVNAPTPPSGFCNNWKFETGPLATT